MGDSEDPIYRIICCENTDYSLASRGGHVVFALTNAFDRYQHWMKDERHGATIKDSEGEPAFAVVNKATDQAISHCPNAEPVPLVPYNMNYCKSVLWTMSRHQDKGFRLIRMADFVHVIWVARNSTILDGHIMVLLIIDDNYEFKFPALTWKFEKVSHSSCITLFRPPQHTVKIICQVKVGYNLAIDKDGRTVLLVPSNPKDKYQHWIKETAYGVTVKDKKGQEAFALVNKATGKAIKHGFGNKYLVLVAPFNRNYMDPSLLWTGSSHVVNGFHEITMQNNTKLAFAIFDDDLENSSLLGLMKTGTSSSNKWKIEDFE